MDDASSKLVITLGWQNAVTFQPTIELFDPDGNPIVPTDVLAPTAGPSAVRRMMPTNQVWEVIDLIPGTYKLVVTNLFQEHFLSFSVESFYQMYLFAGAPIESLSQGVQVPILAALVAPDGPLTGADVNAAVRDPSGALRALHLFDDGNHGDGEAEDGVYGNLYSITSMADGSVSAPPAPGEEGPSVIGSYLVNAVATKGDLRREAQTSFAIQEGADEDGDRLPDAWEKLWGIDTPDGDADGDKLSNYCEYQGGTNPLNSDTDGGGESDGSESPQCYADPNGQDPFDPSDDRVRRPGGFHIRPWLTLDLTPVLRLWWPLPEVGDPFHFQLDRRPVGTDGTPGPWETLAPDLTAPTYEDGSLIVGDLYQYRRFTFVETISGTL